VESRDGHGMQYATDRDGVAQAHASATSSFSVCSAESRACCPRLRQNNQMDHSNLDTLTDAYLRGHHEDHWAWEEWQRIVKADLNAAWKLTLLMLERAESDGLGRVAAGPLEDLIDLHGHKALDLIEEECKNNSRLQVALSQVGVLFYYDEFDRWYALLCKYGLRHTTRPVRTPQNPLDRTPSQLCSGCPTRS